MLFSSITQTFLIRRVFQDSVIVIPNFFSRDSACPPWEAQRRAMLKRHGLKHRNKIEGHILQGRFLNLDLL
ncbi:hypothetical protein ACJX0J_029576, partial [Zea mays]